MGWRLRAVDRRGGDGSYIGFRNYSADVTSISANTTVTRVETNNGTTPPTVETTTTRTAGKRRTVDVEDFQAVMAGGIIRF